MARFVSPYFQYLRLGQPLTNGFIAFFENGTTTPAVTFSDNNLTTQNPLQIPLDSNGAPQNDIFFSGTLRCRVFDDNGQLFEKDFVGDQTAFNQLDLYQAPVVYDQDDLVRLEGGRTFQSLQDDNQANQPETSPAFWKELPTGGIWNPNVTYGLGVVAQSSTGNQWKSNASGNINNDPETDDGTNWSPAVDTANILVPTNTVVVKTGGGTLDALRINELQDASTYDIPLANSVSANQTIVVTQSLQFASNEPTVQRSGTDVIQINGSTDTAILFDQSGSRDIRLTSNGVDTWRLTV